jgi:hypothetical protein
MITVCKLSSHISRKRRKIFFEVKNSVSFGMSETKRKGSEFMYVENEAHGDDTCLLIDILMINGWIDEPPMN